MKCRFALCVAVAVALLFVPGCDQGKGKEKSGPRAGKPADRPPLIDPKKPAPARLVVVDNATHNFGKMSQQTLGHHTFEIMNEGPNPLKVRLANTSCGCTSVKFAGIDWTPEHNPIPPNDIVVVPVGDKLAVEISWNTKERVGQFSTIAKFESSDAGDPAPEFRVEGEILPFVEVTQNQISLVGARNSEVTTTSFYVFSKIKEDLEITEITSSSEKVTTEFEPATEDIVKGLGATRAFKCIVNVQPGVPIGPFNAALVVRTNCEERAELNVTLSGTFSGDVVLSPAKLEFGHVQAGESTKLSVFVTIRAEADIEVKVKRIVPQFLVPELKRLGKNRFRLQVEVPPGAAGGHLERAGIELETNHPGCESVKIPISGLVTDPLDAAARVTGP